MSKGKDVSLVPKAELDKNKDVVETFEDALKDSMSVLPNLATISERLEKSLKLVETAETKISELLEDSKDTAFIVTAHASAVRGSAILMDSARKYVESIAKMWGLGLAPPRKEENGLFDPDYLQGDETDEELSGSVNSSMFGSKKGVNA